MGSVIIVAGVLHFRDDIFLEDVVVGLLGPLHIEGEATYFADDGTT